MTRKLKLLIACACTVLAASAIVAPAAPASNFTASAYPTSLRASGPSWTNRFKTEAGTVECAVELSGTLTGPSETLTVSASYWGCSAFGFLMATFNMNGCDYVFHTSGAVDLVCPSGKSAIVTASTCEMTMGAQSGLKSFFFTNFAGAISVEASLSGIAYTVTKDGFGCPFGGTGSKTGATYTSTALTLESVSATTVDVG